MPDPSPDSEAAPSPTRRPPAGSPNAAPSPTRRPPDEAPSPTRRPPAGSPGQVPSPSPSTHRRRLLFEEFTGELSLEAVAGRVVLLADYQRRVHRSLME